MGVKSKKETTETVFIECRVTSSLFRTTKFLEIRNKVKNIKGKNVVDS